MFSQGDLVVFPRSNKQLQTGIIIQKIGSKLEIEWNDKDVVFGRIINCNKCALLRKSKLSWLFFFKRIFCTIFTYKIILLILFLQIFLFGLYSNYADHEEKRISCLQSNSLFNRFFFSCGEKKNIWKVKIC